MMNTKIVVATIVVVVIIAAAATVVVMNNNGEKEYEYDPSKGWYSWDPITLETKTSYFSITPLLTTGVEKMYEDIYGEKVDYSKYTIDDVPEDFLSYESLIVSVNENNVVVNSTVRESSASSGGVAIKTTVDKCPDNLLCTAGYAATLYTLLEMKYGASTAETKLWDYVYGLDKSSFPGQSADMKALYGLTIPEDVISITSTYSLISNLEAYVDYVGGATSNGESFVMMASGALGNDYSELGPFYNVLESANGPASSVFFFSNNIGDVLAAFEVVGAIYDLEDQAKQYIDNIRLTLYSINQESLAHNAGYTVYLESNSGTACGNGTITSDAFELLGLSNINTTDQWQTISEEVIIDKMPNVIIFYDNNTKSWDERMRVGSSVI